MSGDSTPVAAADDVSNKEFEAGLSLLHMMQHPSKSSDNGDAAAGKPSKKRKESTPKAASSRVAKKSKTLSEGAPLDSGILLLAVAQQMDQSSKDGDDGDDDDDNDDDDDGASSGGFPRRNSQLNMLSHDLSLDELRKHFNKPIVEVAKDFGICTTFLKKICRRLGIKRWPHRQIRSLTRTIEMLEQAEANASSVAEKMKYAAQIAHVKTKMSAVILDPDANGKLERVKKSVLNRSGSPNVKKATRAPAASVVVQADLLHAVAVAAAAAAAKPTELSGSVTPVSVVATAAEAEAAEALLSTMSPRVDPIDAQHDVSDETSVLMPAMTPKSKPLAGSLSDDNSLRISPINRKLLAVTKTDGRVRSSSLGSLQDLDEADNAQPPIIDEPRSAITAS